MHNKYRARTNKLLGSLTMVRCPKALCLSEENMSQMGRGWIPLHCGAETSSVLLSCSLLISWFIFFCLSFRNSPLTFMLLSVRISTASLTLLICLTWWGFHVFFHTLIIFSIKVTEIYSPVSNLSLNERQQPWIKAALPSHMLFLHQRNITCTSNEAHLVSLLRLPELWLTLTSLLLL